VKEVINFFDNILDLDSYFEFKKKFKFSNTVFYALPRYENSSEKKNYIIPESEQFE
jgi:hypothetical protein